ncbi:MAG: AMP nucleosidase, partial [Phaeobacter italicus]
MSDILCPDPIASKDFTDAKEAVAQLIVLYNQAEEFLTGQFRQAMERGAPAHRIRAFYPEVRITTSSYAQIDTRLSFGHIAAPGTYATTITRPDLFKNYLTQQIGLLMRNHKLPVTIGVSDTPIPVHFAVTRYADLTIPQEGAADFILRDVFDVPDLATTNDDIVNGTHVSPNGTGPLSLFTAQRIDYSLARLAHYTATDPVHFQNHVLFTNYQIYVSEFVAYARNQLANANSGYSS